MKCIKKIAWSLVFISVNLLYAQEFVIAKKAKTKKETTQQVKEEIVELLESNLRQLGLNIQQAVTAQNKVCDDLKKLLHNTDASIDQLKNDRDRLVVQLKKLEDHQSVLYTF